MHAQGLEQVVTYDTAGSAKMIAEGGAAQYGDAAAIASRSAAKHYGLNVLMGGVQVCAVFPVPPVVAALVCAALWPAAAFAVCCSCCCAAVVCCG